jgi:hypothetical protein
MLWRKEQELHSSRSIWSVYGMTNNYKESLFSSFLEKNISYNYNGAKNLNTIQYAYDDILQWILNVSLKRFSHSPLKSHRSPPNKTTAINEPWKRCEPDKKQDFCSLHESLKPNLN